MLLGLFPLIPAAEAVAQGSEATPPEYFYEVVVERNVMVPTGDGVGLATDVYRPARNGIPVEGRRSAVLFRIPYGKHRPGTVEQARFFARHGYVYVAQDSRGRFASEGVFTPFGLQEADDGRTTASWIVRQPWSDGRLATLGVSYGGMTQLQLGETDPPGLSVQYIREMGMNPFRTGIYVGGAVHMRRIAWILRHAVFDPVAQENPGIRRALEEMHRELPEWYRQFPRAFARGATPLAHLPRWEDLLVGVIENDRYTSFYGDRVFNIERGLDRYADVPILWHGGWYDIYSAQTPADFVRMSEAKRSPQKLIMGPWIHGQAGESAHGEVEFGEAAAMDADVLALRWYDAVLRDVDNGMLQDPPVRLFVMGTGDGHRTEEGRIFHGGSWRFEDAWPLARAQNTSFYLHAGGLLSQEAPEAGVPPTAYLHDPANPVPTRGGVDPYPWGGIDRVGAFDQREGIGQGLHLRHRPDVVVFETEPLEGDVEVTGPITLLLHASSSLVDTDFTVKLLDVYPASPSWPEGFHLPLSDGILRASRRDPLGEPQPLVPGEVVLLEIEVPPTSNVFKRGHRIRIDIASSNFPRFDLNAGTMEGPWDRRRFLPAENRIYHESEYPSRLILPVVPGGLGTDGEGADGPIR